MINDVIRPSRLDLRPMRSPRDSPRLPVPTPVAVIIHVAPVRFAPSHARSKSSGHVELHDPHRTRDRAAPATIPETLEVIQRGGRHVMAASPCITTASLTAGLSACQRKPPSEREIDRSRSGGVVSRMDYSDRITIEPGKRGGKPCIRGMRITVGDVLEYLASGMSEDEILEEFPYLEREDIKAVLAFAADRERKLQVT